MKIKNNIFQMFGGFPDINQWYTLAQLISGRGIKYILSQLPIDEAIDIFFNNHKASLNATTVKTNIFKNLGAITREDKQSKLGSLIWFGNENK
jgi:hypothetical protein